ncbi:MAG: hypothetical protein AB8B91_02610 [Rubripirellula sp.]
MNFYYVYKALAHPENNGYVAPFNLKERLMHVAEAKRQLGTRFQWLCDSMQNDLKHALGDRPNSEFIIDPTGKIVVSRTWSDAQMLRDDLSRLVGPVENPTSIRELNMPVMQPPTKAPTGIVQRVQLPEGMRPVFVKPQADDANKKPSPHYAKLRAEMSGDQLYLGFFLDPLYKVHWNNKAPALKYSIESPDGVSVTPAQGVFRDVEVGADADPREFLVTLSGRSSDPFKVIVKYFACDDAETFCVPVTQEYLVTMEYDRDGGSRRSSGGARGRGRSMAGRGPGGLGSRMAEMMQRHPVIAALDRDKDGTLSLAELKIASKSLAEADQNADGEISGQELRPSGGPGNQRNR